MKKTYRIIALLPVICLAAFTLCSCQELDRLKEERAVYNADRTEIAYKGESYRLIESGKFDFIEEFHYSWNDNHVADADVPVLLADTYGDYMSVNTQSTMLRVNADENKMPRQTKQKSVDPDLSSSYTYRNFYYARSDKYDEIKQAVADAKLDHYYFTYWAYDDAEYYAEEASYKSIPASGYANILLDEEATAAVNNALAASRKDKVEYTVLGDANGDMKTIELYPCDKNMIISQPNTSYHLVQAKEKYYFWDGNYYDSRSIYPLNEKDSATVKAVFEKYPDAATDNDFLWQFTNLTDNNNVYDAPEYDE